MRRRAVLIVLLATCACACGGGPATADDGPLDLTVEIVDPPTAAAFDGFAAVTFPITTDLRTVALDDPAAADLVAGTELPRGDWRTVAATDSKALVVASTADPGTYAYAGFERMRDEWVLAQFGDGARPGLVIPGDGAPVAWTVVAIDGAEATLQLEPSACRSGAPLDGDDVRIVGWPTANGLALAIAEDPPGGDVDCQSRPSSEAHLTLPPGTTALVEGRTPTGAEDG